MIKHTQLDNIIRVGWTGEPKYYHVICMDLYLYIQRTDTECILRHIIITHNIATHTFYTSQRVEVPPNPSSNAAIMHVRKRRRFSSNISDFVSYFSFCIQPLANEQLFLLTNYVACLVHLRRRTRVIKDASMSLKSRRLF